MATNSSPLIKSMKSGQTLFNEGEPSRSLYIVKRGAISIRKMKAKQLTEIAKVQANEVIGELAFFDRAPRSATAVAVIDSEVLEISYENMDKLYAGTPDYLKTIVACMAARLRKANEQLLQLQIRSRNSRTVNEDSSSGQSREDDTDFN